MKKVKIPKFANKSELFAWLVENKELLIATKKSILKRGDGIEFGNTFLTEFGEKETVIKANEPVLGDMSELKVRAIINTTNIMDSHKDVHIPGLWTKSLKENKLIMHIQEHKMEFDKIISDKKDLKAYAKFFGWKELGFDFEGKTESLTFDSVIKKTRNKFMFGQYKDGHVNNHSVGMRYVQLVMAINSDKYGAEFEAWEKYYPMIVNKDTADESGYFWAVKEAKVIEGSAVPLGSNYATPTFDNNIKIFEPSKDTQSEEPPQGTQEIKEINYLSLIKNWKQ